MVFVVHARALAQLLVRADASADLRQGTGLVIELRGLKKLALFDQPHCRWNIIVCGASQHAGRGVRAVDATRGLKHGAFRIKLNDHVLEIGGAALSRTQVQITEGFVCRVLFDRSQGIRWELPAYVLQTGTHSRPES